MPVIRENRTYSIGPVGVARLSSPVPSSNGSQAIAEAVSSAANVMADQFFREGAKRAEQFGVEQGSSVAKETILAIDPATGAPKAYETPKGFGTIAQDAYQRVVLTRFQSSVEEEIRLKAKELAAVYDGSVERYSAAMSEYIGAMAVNADGQFQTYIQDVGTSYLNATRTAMAIDQINRERTAAAKAQEASIAAGLDALQTMVASQGAASAFSETPTPASITNTSLDVSAKDLKAAELVTTKQYDQLGSDKLVAIGSGQIQFISSKVESSTQAKLLHAAITSGDLSLIQDDSLRNIMSALSYDDRKKMEKVSLDFLSDRADYLKIVEDEQLAAYKAESAVAAIDVAQNSTSLISNITLRATQSPLNAVVPATSQAYYDTMTLAAQLESNGRTDEAAAYRKSADNEFNAAVAGVFNRTLLNADSAETDAIERAVRNRNPQMAPPDKRSSVEAIIALENVRTGVIESFGSTAQSHREDTGKIITEREQLQAFAETESLIKSASVSMASLSPDQISIAYANGVSAIGNSGMDPDKALSLRKTFANTAAAANLSNVFRSDQLPTSQQMDAMQTYINDGVDAGILTQTQIEALDNVREFVSISEDRASVTTKLNQYIEQTEKFYTAETIEKEKVSTFTAIERGQLDGSKPENQKAGDDYLERKYPDLIGKSTGVKIGDVISDPALYNDPQYQGVLNELSRMSVLPDSAAQVFRGVANNTIGADRLAFALRSYENLRYNTSSMTGEEISSPAIKSAIGKDMAKLDMMSAVYKNSNFSIDEVQKASRLYDTNQDPVVKERFEKTFGNLDVLISELDGIDSAMPEDIEYLKFAVLGLAASAEVSGMSRSGIIDTVQRQADLSFPIDRNVMTAGGDLRTSLAPSVTVGRNAPLFSKYALQVATQAGIFSDGQKSSKVRMADLTNINAPSLSTSTAGLGRFGGVTTPDPNAKKIFFKPNGPSASGGQIYTVMEYRSYGDGNPVAVRKEINVNGTKLSIPLTVDTKDPEFVQMIALEEARLQVEGAASAARSKRLMQIGAFSPMGASILLSNAVGPELFGNPIPDAGAE